MLNRTEVQFNNKASTGYISITSTIYNQTMHLVLFMATRMEYVLPLAESSILVETNTLLAFIMSKSISITHTCKVMVIIIYICIFIHKKSVLTFCTTLQIMFPLWLAPILNPSIPLFCCLIKAISSFRSFVTLVSNSSCWVKAWIWKMLFTFGVTESLFLEIFEFVKIDW